jgi:hypothetical protein
MIWRRTASNHLGAIGGFARQWLGGTMLDRLIPVTLIGWLWCALWLLLGLISQEPSVLLLLLLFVCPIPWGLWLLDALLDASQVKQDIAGFAKEGAILATRCEYLGGHPQLPHGRFAYLLLEGTKQNPNLTIVFPAVLANNNGTPVPTEPMNAERFILPILDLGKMKPEKGSDASPAADLATAINAGAGRMLRPERLTFVVDYDGNGGRKHKVEFTNFFHGNNEIRNWQNYLVCAQAQADTGIEPHAPWVALPNDPTPTSDLLTTTKELEAEHAFSGNGHEERKPSSAFTRR